MCHVPPLDGAKLDVAQYRGLVAADDFGRFAQTNPAVVLPAVLT